MADLIGEHMQDHGIKFIRNSVPKRVDKLEDGRLKVTYDSYEWGEEHSDVFDTVIMAVGMFIYVSILYFLTETSRVTDGLTDHVTD